MPARSPPRRGGGPGASPQLPHRSRPGIRSHPGAPGHWPAARWRPHARRAPARGSGAFPAAPGARPGSKNPAAYHDHPVLRRDRGPLGSRGRAAAGPAGGQLDDTHQRCDGAMESVVPLAAKLRGRWDSETPPGAARSPPSGSHRGRPSVQALDSPEPTGGRAGGTACATPKDNAQVEQAPRGGGIVMSRCSVCGQQIVGNMAFCPHHVGGAPEGWATSNRIMCDFLHRGIVPPRLGAVDRLDDLSQRLAGTM
jgi:hypothetical protein